MTVQFDADAALRQLTELAQRHGPEAVQMAANIAQVNAIGNLVSGAISALAAVAVGIVARQLGRTDWSGPTARNICSIVGGIVAIVAAANALFYLGNIWNWIGAFNPRLALAHDIYTRLTAVVS